MSKRRISENLEYDVDNEGLTYETDGTITITANTFNYNGQPIVTGAVTGSSTVNVGALPARILQTYYPRMVQLFKNNFAVLADTNTVVSWDTPTVQVDTFALAPLTPTGSSYTSFINYLSSGQWGFNIKGHWRFEFTVNLTAAATVDELTQMQIEVRPVAAGVFAAVAGNSVKRTTGDIGTNNVLNLSTDVYLDPALATNDQRLRFTICSGQALNSGVEYTLKMILLRPF